jgi:hypothetical protein
MKKQGQTQQVLDSTQPQVLVPGRYIEGMFKVCSHIRFLIRGTEMIPNTLVSFDYLSQLMA